MHMSRRTHHWSCECGNPTCKRHVTLTHGEAKSIMANSQIVIVDGCRFGAPDGAQLAAHAEGYDLYWPVPAASSEQADEPITSPY